MVVEFPLAAALTGFIPDARKFDLTLGVVVIVDLYLEKQGKVYGIGYFVLSTAQSLGEHIESQQW